MVVPTLVGRAVLSRFDGAWMHAQLERVWACASRSSGVIDFPWAVSVVLQRFRVMEDLFGQL